MLIMLILGVLSLGTTMNDAPQMLPKNKVLLFIFELCAFIEPRYALGVELKSNILKI